MKHAEPHPKNKTKIHNTKAPVKKLSLLTSLIPVLLIIGGLGYGMSSMLGAHSTDKVSEAEKQKLTINYSQLSSMGLQQIPEKDFQAVLDTMRLPPHQRESLKQALHASQENRTSPTTGENLEELTLAWITLWDSHAQDGDVVRVSSAGYQIDVPLLKKPTRVAISVDKSRRVKITGIKDGGGGITLGVMNGDTTTAMPLLTTGQTMDIPVSF